jgi:hypothetical protein
MPVTGGLRRALTAAVLAATIVGCQPPVEHTARAAAQPSAIAVAMCSQYRPKDPAGCDRLRLPDPASEIAYAGCLEYNRKDLKPCGALRVAYESDLHAYLDTTRSHITRAVATPAAPSPAGDQTRVLHSTAVVLFKASNSDADTFQAALLIPDIRHNIELALGQHLSDAELQALIRKTRSEAVYWYTYMQRLEHTE